ncbi:hypothetical protein [Acidocella sp.]|uniref:hypothetical protein n=1 Tax=Acidocella sp. TaxID=50710 RepID=UPI002617F6FA|nr:hypothetical protein [Acidocella sp.]
MKRLILACVLGITAGGMIPGGAMAQTASTAASATTKSTGLAKPPPGTTAPQPRRLDHSNASVQGNNTPTLPQIALHPQATIGSPVPIAGPGGTSRSPTGD